MALLPPPSACRDIQHHLALLSWLLLDSSCAALTFVNASWGLKSHREEPFWNILHELRPCPRENWIVLADGRAWLRRLPCSHMVGDVSHPRGFEQGAGLP